MMMNKFAFLNLFLLICLNIWSNIIIYRDCLKGTHFSLSYYHSVFNKYLNIFKKEWLMLAKIYL
jgi:hypothetical protein